MPPPPRGVLWVLAALAALGGAAERLTYSEGFYAHWHLLPTLELSGGQRATLELGLNEAQAILYGAARVNNHIKQMEGSRLLEPHCTFCYANASAPAGPGCPPPGLGQCAAHQTCAGYTDPVCGGKAVPAALARPATGRAQDGTPAPYGNGTSGVPSYADLVVVVASELDSRCNAQCTVRGYSEVCQRDPATGRPTFGFVNVCPCAVPPARLDTKFASTVSAMALDFASFTGLVVHELLHVAFATTRSFAYYRDDAGDACTARDQCGRVVSAATFPDNNSPLPDPTCNILRLSPSKNPRLATRRAVRAVASLTGCPEATVAQHGGMLLHTDYSHMHPRHKCSVLHPVPPMDTRSCPRDYPCLDQLLAGWMEDTGWFGVKRTCAQAVYGVDAGCIYNQDSMQWCNATFGAWDPTNLFCTVKNEAGCNPSHAATGSCRITTLSNRAPVVNLASPNDAGDADLDWCPRRESSTLGDCRFVRRDATANERFGEHSVCAAAQRSDGQAYAMCVDKECEWRDGEPVLVLQGANALFRQECTPGGWRSTRFRWENDPGLLMQCPNPRIVCGSANWTTRTLPETLPCCPAGPEARFNLACRGACPAAAGGQSVAVTRTGGAGGKGGGGGNDTLYWGLVVVTVAMGGLLCALCTVGAVQRWRREQPERSLEPRREPPPPVPPTPVPPVPPAPVPPAPPAPAPPAPAAARWHPPRASPAGGGGSAALARCWAAVREFFCMDRPPPPTVQARHRAQPDNGFF